MAGLINIGFGNMVNTDKIILSALQPETLAGRFNGSTAEVCDDAKD